MPSQATALEVTESDFSDLASLTVVRKGTTVEVFTDHGTKESDWRKVCDRLLPAGLKVTGEFIEDSAVVFVWN